MEVITLKVKMIADLSLVGCAGSEIVEITMTITEYQDIHKMEKIINSTFEKWVWNRVSSSSYWEIVEQPL